MRGESTNFKDRERYNNYTQRLRGLQNIDDIEYAHVEADKILCEILEELGLTEVVEEYNKVPKWYA